MKILRIFNIKDTYKYHRLKSKFEAYYVLVICWFQKNILNKKPTIIILTEHIGDLVAFSPIAEHVKKTEKKRFLIWLVNPRYAEVLQYNPFIDLTFSINCDLVADICKKSKFEVWDVRFNDNNYCVLCKTDKVNNKIDSKFNLQNYFDYGSLLEVFSRFTPYPLKNESSFPKIYLTNNERSQLKEKVNYPEKYIVIHVESNDPIREWEAAKWHKLLEYLTSKNWQVYCVGLKQRLNFTNEPFIDLSGKLTILQTAALIENATYFIGIESSMGHFANAFEIPSTVLLGQFRDCVNYMPYSGFFVNDKSVNLLYKHNRKMTDITIEEVINKLPQYIHEMPTNGAHTNAR